MAPQWPILVFLLLRSRKLFWKQEFCSYWRGKVVWPPSRPSCNNRQIQLFSPHGYYTDIYSMGHCTKYCTIGAISLGPCKVPLLLWPPDTTLLLYIITLSSNRLWHTLVSVVCVCGYANASAISQEEIKEDNSSSNSFLLHPSVMLTTVHILEMEMHLLLRVCKCVLQMLAQTRAEKNLSFHSRNACLSCTVECLAEWGGEEAEWRYQLYHTH